MDTLWHHAAFELPPVPEAFKATHPKISSSPTHRIFSSRPQPAARFLDSLVDLGCLHTRTVQMSDQGGLRFNILSTHLVLELSWALVLDLA